MLETFLLLGTDILPSAEQSTVNNSPEYISEYQIVVRVRVIVSIVGHTVLPLPENDYPPRFRTPHFIVGCTIVPSTHRTIHMVEIPPFSIPK